jgi:hypothetical protein
VPTIRTELLESYELARTSPNQEEYLALLRKIAAMEETLSKPVSDLMCMFRGGCQHPGLCHADCEHPAIILASCERDAQDKLTHFRDHLTSLVMAAFHRRAGG